MVERRNIGQTQPDQIWKRQRARFRDVTQRVAARVSVLACVGKRANPHAVEHNPDDSFEHYRHSIKLDKKEYTTAYLTDEIIASILTR